MTGWGSRHPFPQHLERHLHGVARAALRALHDELQFALGKKRQAGDGFFDIFGGVKNRASILEEGFRICASRELHF